MAVPSMAVTRATGCAGLQSSTCGRSCVLPPRCCRSRRFRRGRGVSYGHRYVTERPTKLAVLPVGYADGYLRRMTGKAEALLAGQRAPIRGMICMNACMADVTDIPGVKAGDAAVLLGCQGAGEIRAEEIARWSETINYEILCLFGSCNRQVHYDSEKPATPSVC